MNICNLVLWVISFPRKEIRMLCTTKVSTLIHRKSTWGMRVALTYFCGGWEALGLLVGPLAHRVSADYLVLMLKERQQVLEVVVGIAFVVYRQHPKVG